MTNTKWLSALLAGTALTVASTAAMADTSFLAMKRNAPAQGVTFSVLPTADMPAAATSVTISGAVAAFLESSDATNADSELNIVTEGDVTIDASTDTAIGKVAVTANANLEAKTWSSYVGSLEFAPGASFSGGHGGLYKADGYTAAGTSNMFGYGDANASTQFIGFDYVTGPVSFGAKAYDNAFVTGVTDKRIGLNGMIGYDLGSGIKAKVVGASVGDAGPGQESDYLLGGHLNFSMDMFSVVVAANTGEGPATHKARDTDVVGDDKWTSYGATLALSPIESWTFAASYGKETNKNGTGSNDDTVADSYTLSAKWSPVAQYDIVLAYNTGESKTGSTKTDNEVIGLGIWWKF